ncbi:NADH-quinone oxidoreductase subunit C [Streptomyces collinus]|uniref:NADH-quinone oxidoreductase subunit C n=1 Tax=Streptomyces collinus TaxID=42684 RepID=UPI0036779C28
MSTAGWLPAPAEELFGPEATAEEAYEVLTVDVPPSAWLTALETARTTLSCTYFDWLSAVDEPGTGFRVSAHVVALSPVRRLLLRTTVPHEAPALPSAVGVYAGAAWHERETHEMFGVDFENHPGLDHLLLPDTFEGHPLRKDFVLAARVAKAWPGAKEPGESDHGGPRRRQMLPPGVPDPNEWGPLKGTLPAAPARPARAAGERPARAAGERPVRRTRTAAAGSASQAAEPGTAATAPGATETASGTAAGPAGAAARPRRTRSASEGSASQAAGPGEAGTPAGAPSGAAAESASGAATGPAAAAGAAGAAGVAGRPRRSRSASEGSVSQTAAKDDAAERKQAAAEGDASRAAAETPGAEGPAAEGSVAHEPTSAPAPTPAGPRRARSVSGGSASQRAATEEPAGTEPAGSEPAGAEPSGPGEGPGRPARRSTAPRSSDAPWHHARPAFDEKREPERAQSPERRPESPEPRPEAEAPQPETPEDPKEREPADRDTPEDPTGGPQ